MSQHVLEREQRIAASVDRVFDFFSDAANLAEITPGWLGFQIQSPLPIEMRAGARIEYRIHLAGWPIRWVTRIAAWNPPHSFVDLQEQGPYASWEHTHEFQRDGDALRMRDTVRYALPLGALGDLAHAIAVRRALDAIFDYRRRTIEHRFGTSDGYSATPASSTCSGGSGSP